MLVRCLVGLLSLLALSVAWAGDGTPNLGTTQVGQVPSRWFLDARVYDTASGQDWYDNTTLSLGFVAPVNSDTEFGLVYSDLGNTGPDLLGGEGESNPALRSSERKVLCPTVKFRLKGANGGTGVAVTVGADVELDKASGMDNAGGGVAFQQTFTPAGKLLVEFGQPGRTQYQLAGQVAAWPTLCPTSQGGLIPGFGTVCCLGGGAIVPVSRKLVLSGDIMFPVGGDNTIDDQTNAPDTEPVWSAGGTWMFGGDADMTLSVYATNSMAPTLAASVIGAPDNSTAFSVALRRNF